VGRTSNFICAGLGRLSTSRAQSCQQYGARSTESSKPSKPSKSSKSSNQRSYGNPHISPSGLHTCIGDVPEPALLWCDLLLSVLLLQAGGPNVDPGVPGVASMR